MLKDDHFPLRLHHAIIWAFNLDEYMFNPIFQDGYWIPPDEHILNILNNTSGLSYCSQHDIRVVIYVSYLFYLTNPNLFRLLLYDELKV